MWCPGYMFLMLLDFFTWNTLQQPVPQFYIEQDFTSCENGWFGIKCRYMCRCTQLQCDETGRCKEGFDCMEGWFGPECQYSDYIKDSETALWLKDHNDSTCGSIHHADRLAVSLQRPSYFTWLRYRVEDSDLTDKLNITFMNNDVPFFCLEPLMVLVDKVTVDLYCEITDSLITDIFLEGPALKGLCSLYASRGRNVALRRKAVAFTMAGQCGPSYAVDDKLGQDVNYDQCYMAKDLDTDAYLHVNYEDELHRISLVIIFNSVVKGSMEKMKGFAVSSQPLASRTVINEYRDTLAFVQSVYYVDHPMNLSVGGIYIQPGNETEGYFAVCEFQTYGEIICPKHAWGRDCEQQCNCYNVSGDAYCTTSTGACSNGCSPGFMYAGCNTPCPVGTYGRDCVYMCSNCRGGLCEPQNGVCSNGCARGFTGWPDCYTKCSKGSFGYNCTSTCLNCQDFQCNPVNGICEIGCRKGYIGFPTCYKECSTGTFGVKCTSRCRNCQDFLCNPLNGSCEKGCQKGITGFPRCNINCPPGVYSYDCDKACPENCLHQECNPVTGICLLGCVGTYLGSFCDKAKSIMTNLSSFSEKEKIVPKAVSVDTPDNNASSSISWLLFLVVSLIVALGIGFICCLEKRKQMLAEKPPSEEN